MGNVDKNLIYPANTLLLFDTSLFAKSPSTGFSPVCTEQLVTHSNSLHRVTVKISYPTSQTSADIQHLSLDSGHCHVCIQKGYTV